MNGLKNVYGFIVRTRILEEVDGEIIEEGTKQSSMTTCCTFPRLILTNSLVVVVDLRFNLNVLWGRCVLYY